jgi:organic radical activating enzyme
MEQRFEKSWQAARGAAVDAGVRLTTEDRGTGTLRGAVGSSEVSITVVPQQVDQTIQVGFSVTGGEPSQDANLKEHLTHAYQRRMGR